jgi:Flp pilus assembly protein TadD
LDTPEARRDVSVSLNNVAQILAAKGDLEGARGLFEQSLDIVVGLQQQTGAAELGRDRAICHFNLARVAQAQGDLSAARAALIAAREAAEVFGRQQPISDAGDIVAAVDAALARLG